MTGPVCRFGRRHTCELHLAEHALIYGKRSISPYAIEYLQLDMADPTCLHLKFVSRPRAKAFYFISALACEQAAEQIRTWQAHCLRSGGTSSRPDPLEKQITSMAEADLAWESSYASPAPSLRGSLDELKAILAYSSLSEGTSSPSQPAPVAGLALGRVSYRASEVAQGEQVHEALSRLLRTAWCCRTHVLEALLFGVLMPLAVGGYWLIDAQMDAEARAGIWLAADCTPHTRVMVHWREYHHGKFLHAHDETYQKGDFYVLEPAWNSTVRLREASPDLARPLQWETLVFSVVQASQAPVCTGHVQQPLSETIDMCAARDALQAWAPKLPLNISRPCYVHGAHRDEAFLSVTEPASFYWDLVIVLFFISISLFFASALAYAHWRRLKRVGQRALALVRRCRSLGMLSDAQVAIDGKQAPPLTSAQHSSSTSAQQSCDAHEQTYLEARRAQDPGRTSSTPPTPAGWTASPSVLL